MTEDKKKPSADSDEQVATVRQLLRGPVSDSETAWLDDAAVRRYLRARKGNAAAAATAIEATFQWRRDMALDWKARPSRRHDADKLSSESWDAELATGRLYVSGTDPEGHTVMITRKRADRIGAGERAAYVKFFVWTLEVAAQCMQHGRDQWVWILDLEGYSSANSPPIAVSRETMHTLSHHYPERLRKAYIVNAPTIFWVLWNALWPFLDPVTKRKVHFIYTKDYSEDGTLKSGAQDATGFARYWSHYKTPYSREQYDQLLAQQGL